MLEDKKNPIFEAIVIAALTTLCTGLINLVLEEIKERRKKSNKSPETLK